MSVGVIISLEARFNDCYIMLDGMKMYVKIVSNVKVYLYIGHYGTVVS